MHFFSYLCGISLFVSVLSKNLCFKDLCIGDSPHIACGNTGKFAPSCPADAALVNIKPYKNKILRSFNAKRNVLAFGKLPGFSRAVRMPTLKWDNELADLAAMNVKRCEMLTDCHNTETYKFSGQNVYKLSSSKKKNLEDQLNYGIEYWWAGHKNYTMELINNFTLPEAGTGQFTCLASDLNTAVGCAISTFLSDSNVFLLTCNFAICNMVGKPVYVSGWSGSGCATGVNPKYHALCSKDEDLQMPYKVEALPDSYALLGESPHWDVATQNLYYVDINAGKLLRFDYNENKVYKTKIEGEALAGFVIPVEGTTDKFAVGSGRRVNIVNWDGVSETAVVERTLFEVQSDEKFINNRFNDGKCDPRGRLFAGTMRYVGDEFKYRHGEFYKWEKGGKLEVVKSDVGISNGMAWNEKAKKFYYIDTADYEVKEYDYDFENGVFSNPKVVFDLRKDSPDNHLLPDGMTIDREGNIYVATFNGHTIYKVDPSTGKVLMEIEFPCKQITSAAFGGPRMDILFVTTSSLFDQPEPAGTTYKVTGLGAQGYSYSKLRI